MSKTPMTVNCISAAESEMDRRVEQLEAWAEEKFPDRELWPTVDGVHMTPEVQIAFIQAEWQRRNAKIRVAQIYFAHPGNLAVPRFGERDIAVLATFFADDPRWARGGAKEVLLNEDEFWRLAKTMGLEPPEHLRQLSDEEVGTRIDVAFTGNA